jgi:hypothetical protein
MVAGRQSQRTAAVRQGGVTPHDARNASRFARRFAVAFCCGAYQELLHSHAGVGSLQPLERQFRRDRFGSRRRVG